MVNEQPKALRLANILQTNTMHSQAVDLEAAAELRRLQVENEDFRATIDHLTRENAEQIGEIVALKEQRDELLEALLDALPYVEDVLSNKEQLACFKPGVVERHAKLIRSAIAKATTGETK